MPDKFFNLLTNVTDRNFFAVTKINVNVNKLTTDETSDKLRLHFKKTLKNKLDLFRELIELLRKEKCDLFPLVSLNNFEFKLCNIYSIISSLYLKCYFTC